MAPFYIQCGSTKLVLDVQGGSHDKGTHVVMWPYNGGKHQLWKYKDGMIWSKNNKEHVLDVDTKNKKIIVWPAHGGDNQKWTFEDDGTIINGTGLVLDVCDGCTDNGTSVIAYSKNGGENQMFKAIPVDS